MNRSSLNATTRFSNRVADYVRYRPDYPQAMLAALAEEVGITSDSVIADIGSGTGISTAHLLKLGCQVYAVEPNAEMRQAAEQQLESNPRFHSVAGSAEATTLDSKRIDHIMAGQAFHWFDVEKTKAEFLRVLKDDGLVVLFWNSRQLDTSAFLKAYEAFLHQYGTDYQQVASRYVSPEKLNGFFAGDFQYRTFPNEQVFDFDGLRGRLLSSSYSPSSDHPNYQSMLDALQQLFDKYQESGHVRFEYKTELYFGTI